MHVCPGGGERGRVTSWDIANNRLSVVDQACLYVCDSTAVQL